METYFPYNIDDPQPVTEQLIIDNGLIRLRHIPKAGTLTIDGFTEVDSPINLQSNEFFCYYSADSLYREANRLVYFYRGLSGQRVTCRYGAVGTPIIAEDMNEIKAHLDAGDATVPADIVERLDNLNSEVAALQDAIDNIEPPAEIYERIDAEQTARINADDSLGARVAELERKIDGEPADKTLNDIIFSNKPHSGYNAAGKADFLTYVFGADTPAEYSSGGASAFIEYVF